MCVCVCVCVEERVAEVCVCMFLVFGRRRDVIHHLVVGWTERVQPQTHTHTHTKTLLQ